MSFKSLFIAVLLSIAALNIIGCSGIDSAVSPSDSSLSLVQNTMDLPDAVMGYSSTGIMGAFDLEIDFSDLAVSVEPKRQLTIGESFIVSGISYFTVFPCAGCLNLKGLSITPDNELALTFTIRHPFEKGDPLAPPTARNRLDLDVFDLAAVILPTSQTPYLFQVDYEKAYLDICANPDGYTGELESLLSDGAACPYFLVVDDSIEMPGVDDHYNRFEMGHETEFDVKFLFSPGNTCRFEMYLTMGYGASAVKSTRLNPKYYNPEFNRKAAWKVKATPPEGDNPPSPGNTWTDDDSSTTYNVAIEVYDWQINAEIYSDPANFADAPANNIFSSSNVSSVDVQIMGLTPDWVSVTTPVTGNGLPSNPLVYSVPIANQNLAPAGEYPGLVCVRDTRAGGNPLTDTRDFLIHTPDGKALENYQISEFKTYQVFTATVLGSSAPGDGWALTWAAVASQADHIALDSSNNILVTGSFVQTSDLDPTDGVENHTSNGAEDVYVSKFDQNGNFIWCQTWGGSETDYGFTVTVDNSTNNIYACGFYSGTVDFDPGTGEDPHSTVNPYSMETYVSSFDSNGNFRWAKTWAGYGSPWLEFSGIDVVTDTSNGVWITGTFMDTVDFNPGTGVDEKTSNGAQDVYLLRLSTTGNYSAVLTWGSMGSDVACSIAADSLDNIFCCGAFGGGCDFDPGTGEVFLDYHGELDAWVSKFNSSGVHQWSGTWGCSTMDAAYGLTTDNTGNVYITGYFSNTVDFDPGSGVVNKTSAGGYDVFLSKLNTTGGLVWTKTWGSTAYDIGYGVSVDLTGNIYTVGSFGETCDFDPDAVESFELPSNGQADFFVNKLDSSGDFTWARSWGSTGTDTAYTVKTASNGRIFLAGKFSETVDFDPGIGVDNHTATPGLGMFLMKLMPNGYW
jgi:hypothetical protein